MQTARELEQRGVFWLEEPLSRYDFENLESTTWIDAEGFAHPSEAPGLGVEVVEAMIDRYAV